MHHFKTTNQFEKDYKKAKKSNRKIDNLKKIMQTLVNGEKLTVKYKDHPLRGNYKGYRECHIQPDWLLVYKKTDDCIIFERTGSHSELFDK